MGSSTVVRSWAPSPSTSSSFGLDGSVRAATDGPSNDATWHGRGEVAAFLYTAKRISPMHAAVAVLLGLNGLRVSEACGADIEELGFERGHRT